jgi:hypothetical protein
VVDTVVVGTGGGGKAPGPAIMAQFTTAVSRPPQQMEKMPRLPTTTLQTPMAVITPGRCCSGVA